MFLSPPWRFGPRGTQLIYSYRKPALRQAQPAAVDPLARAAIARKTQAPRPHTRPGRARLLTKYAARGLLDLACNSSRHSMQNKVEHRANLTDFTILPTWCCKKLFGVKPAVQPRALSTFRGIATAYTVEARRVIDKYAAHCPLDQSYSSSQQNMQISAELRSCHVNFEVSPTWHFKCHVE